MAKLSEIHRLIENYIELYGGNIGWNPYTGADKLYIPILKSC